MLRYFMGDYQAGRGQWEEVLAMDRELADRFHEGIRLYVLGLLSRRQADYDRTKELEEQALRLARELGYDDLEGQALAALGDLYQDLGDPAVARESYEQALSVFRRLEMTEQRDLPRAGRTGRGGVGVG